MSRYENGYETRRVIYNAAKRLFFLQGVDRTTYDNIAAEAHVNRGSVYYHFKSKDVLCEAINREIREKGLYVARYLGVEQPFIFPVSFSIGLYCCMNDPDYQRFIRTGLLPKITEFSEKKYDYSSLRLDCFFAFLSPEEIEKISLDPWNEYSLHILDLNLFYLADAYPGKFSLDELMEHFLENTGKLYMVPRHAIESACNKVLEIMQKIDYSTLHIRW